LKSNELLQVRKNLCVFKLVKGIFLGAFGIRKYGSHLNGYVIDDDGTWRMWIGKRSKTKQTFPDMYDNLVRKKFLKILT
jgi:hypothetical protein